MNSKVSGLILTEVVPRLQITSADTRLSYANLLNYTQRAYEDLYYSIVEQKSEYYGKIGYLKFFANNVSATLSANITDYDSSMRFLHLEFKDSANAQYYTGMEISWQDISNPNASYLATQPVYSLYGDLAYLQKPPTADLASCSKVYYIDKASALSGGSVHNLPGGFEDVLINRVCYYGFEHLGQKTKALEFLQSYERDKRTKLSQINNRSKRKRMRDIRDNYFGSYYEGAR